MTEAPVTREPVHTRQITCKSFRRSDGLWDIEGHLTDCRFHPVLSPILDLAPGENMHDLGLVLVIDLGQKIHNLRPTFMAAATPECHQVGGNYRALIGTTIGPGFSRRVREAVGNVAGCTHMTTLLQAMSTAAVQALWHDRPDTRDGLPDWLIGSCHGYRAAGKAVELMAPELFQPEDADG